MVNKTNYIILETVQYKVDIAILEDKWEIMWSIEWHQCH